MAERSSWENDDLSALRDLARSFCEKEIKPNADKFIEQHHVDRDLWNKAANWVFSACRSRRSTGAGAATLRTRPS